MRANPKVKKKDNRSLLAKYAAAPHIVWAVLFIVAPLIFVVYYAFTNASGTISFSNLAEFFTKHLRSIPITRRILL